MSDLSPTIKRLKQRVLTLARQARPHHLALAAAVAVLGIGLASMRVVALPGPRPVADDERLQIRLVTAVEPEITPGSVMDVGDLVEGFEYVPLPPVAGTDAYAPPDEVYEERPRRADRYEERVVVDAPWQPEPPADDWRDSRAGRWFGFDAPERDYRAEREARRARRNTRAEERSFRPEVRRYSSDGPIDRGD